jgi:hypothetical protein
MHGFAVGGGRAGLPADAEQLLTGGVHLTARARELHRELALRLAGLIRRSANGGDFGSVEPKDGK